MGFSRRWLDAVSLLAGAWLFVSPWILGTTSIAAVAWMSYVLGALVVLTAIWAMSAREPRSPELLNALFGALVFIAPWVLGFVNESAARIDAWIVGAVIVVVALWAAMMERPAARPERRGPAI